MSKPSKTGDEWLITASLTNVFSYQFLVFSYFGKYVYCLYNRKKHSTPPSVEARSESFLSIERDHASIGGEDKRRRDRLNGLAIAVKDNICTKGMRSRAARNSQQLQSSIRRGPRSKTERRGSYRRGKDEHGRVCHGLVK